MKLFCDGYRDKNFGLVVFGVSEKGLRYVSFGKHAKWDDVFKYALKYGFEPIKNPGKTSSIKKQLQDYFRGRLRRFRIKFDFDHLTPFTRKVLMAAFKVSYGSTSTYGKLARAAGSPLASRAAGQVMANNPVAPVIPCHRIVGSQGKLTGYAGGLNTKVALLQMEGARPSI